MQRNPTNASLCNLAFHAYSERLKELHGPLKTQCLMLCMMLGAQFMKKKFIFLETLTQKRERR